jgi:hypothetical protein
MLMKLRILVGLLSVSMLGLWACEDSAEKEAEKAKEQQAAEAAKAAEQKAAEPKPAEPAAEPPKPPEVPPKQVCDEAVAAAKAKDEGKLVAHVSGDFGAVEGAKEELTKFLAPAACGDAKIEGEKGMVPLTIGAGKKAKKQELPVVKAADGWKIDGQAFLEKHPLKKVKAKKGGKAKKGKA